MPLHLFLPDPVEQMREEIRLLPESQRPKTPAIHDWTCDPKEQILTHVSTGCQFHAYRLPAPLVEGLVLPFEKFYEIAARFIGMQGNLALPAPDNVRELGRECLTWIVTYTYESSRRRA